MRALRATLAVAAGLAVAAASATGPGAGPVQDAAPTAGVDVPAGALTFALEDEDGRPVPGRLTFVGEQGAGALVFPNTAARPHDLAVRKDVVYSLSGSGTITVPPGRYEVWASRGLEWSVDRTELVVEDGSRHEWTAVLRHEIDTRRWVSGDFHLHTVTHSGHGDSNMQERIISLVGEGVEFAVATDHNHNIDYGPTVETLGARHLLGHVTGNEVSTPIGHFNVFPLEPSHPVPDPEATDAIALFRSIRKMRNRYDVEPLIQLNHPRWRRIDYFGRTGLDPVTGTSSSAAFSYDFDTIEVFNANEGWGYYDADTTERPVGSGIHSVLLDWFNLLDQGRRYTAVGNSDSHTVHHEFAGYPRNFVWSTAGEPGHIDVADVVAAIRDGHCFTTVGPFLEFSVDGVRMGGLVRTYSDEVEVHVKVQAASWIDCDRVKIVVNGAVEQVLEVPETRYPLRLDERVSLELDRDAWICVLVEGDDPMDPIVQSPSRPVLPLAVSNPVWVEVDGDSWDSALDQALGVLGTAGSIEDALAYVGPGDRYLGTLLVAAMESRPAFAADLVRRGLASEDRRAFLAAARCAESLAKAELGPELRAAWPARVDDGYASLALLRALRACGEAIDEPLAEWLEKWGSRGVRYEDELTELMPGAFVSEWMIIGYFPSPAQGTLLEVEYGPEGDPDPEVTHPGKGERDAGWLRVTAGDDGYLDLRSIDPRPEACEDAIAYAVTWLDAPETRRYAYTLGTDDGCRVWVGDELVFEDPSRRTASPLQTTGFLDLAQGWNRVMIKVENGVGGFGVYFRILDDGVTSGAYPE